MLPNRASDQPASLLSRIHTRTHIHTCTHTQTGALCRTLPVLFRCVCACCCTQRLLCRIAEPVVNVMHRELQRWQTAETGYVRDCHVTWEGLFKEGEWGRKWEMAGE